MPDAAAVVAAMLPQQRRALHQLLLADGTAAERDVLQGGHVHHERQRGGCSDRSADGASGIICANLWANLMLRSRLKCLAAAAKPASVAP